MLIRFYLTIKNKASSFCTRCATTSLGSFSSVPLLHFHFFSAAYNYMTIYVIKRSLFLPASSPLCFVPRVAILFGALHTRTQPLTYVTVRFRQFGNFPSLTCLRTYFLSLSIWSPSCNFRTPMNLVPCDSPIYFGIRGGGA